MLRYVIPGLALLTLASAAVSASKTPGTMGVYVRFSEAIKSPHKLREEMKLIKATGIDFIIPQGKLTSGKVNWASEVASKEMIANPDYMEMVVKYAHSVGLKVYPCFCVCPEGGESSLNAVLKKNLSWAWYYQGERRGYIDPGNADARRYETALVAELVGKYDIDGLSLDYLRCPNRVGYTDTGRAAMLEAHSVDLAKIVETEVVDLDTEGGKKAVPASHSSVLKHPVWPHWKKWRMEQVNTLLREIREAVNKTKPGLPVSSYVWGYHTYTGTSEACQDWMTWIRKGWIDWINPSGYRYDDESFLKAASDNRAHVPKGFPFYITIGVYTSHGRLQDANEIRKHMKMAKDNGADGLVFFTWETLKPFADEVAPDIKAYSQGR